MAEDQERTEDRERLEKLMSRLESYLLSLEQMRLREYIHFLGDRKRLMRSHFWGGVARGLGVAVLPFLLVKRDIEEKNVALAPLDPPLTRHLHVIFHQSKYRTASMETFLSLCLEYGVSSGHPAGGPISLHSAASDRG